MDESIVEVKPNIREKEPKWLLYVDSSSKRQQDGLVLFLQPQTISSSIQTVQ